MVVITVLFLFACKDNAFPRNNKTKCKLFFNKVKTIPSIIAKSQDGSKVQEFKVFILLPPSGFFVHSPEGAK
jgi:hypothetical protein